MNTINPTGYCYHCKQNVLLSREDIDICLALILLIFTAGIGLVFYMLYYYRKEEIRCVHCGATCSPTFNRSETQIAPQISNQPQHQEKILQEQKPVETKKAGVNFCPLCGEEFDQEGVKFCPSCGNKV